MVTTPARQLIANADGKKIIIDGHHRAAAAIKAGIKEVLVKTIPTTSQQNSQLLVQAAEAKRLGDMSLVSQGTLYEFDSVQKMLLTAFFEAFSVPAADFLASVPKRGELTLGTEKWLFHKHGLGVMFENDATGTVVDAHRIYSEIPSAIDAWRLLQFLESMGVSSLTENAVESSLRDSVKSGVLASTSYPGVYAIKGSQGS